uniref:Trypsin-like serine protease n=1 Tax=Lutzomyia longipalpis TaxID=7200 RepID=A0A1B0CQ41_LUTLO
AVIAEIAEIHIHPDFTRNNGGAFDADIAVLIMQKPAEFGDFIQPACLRHSESLPADRMGVIVGWGRDEHNNLLTYEPRRLEIPIVSEAECLAAGKIFSIITTPRTFCGGWRDGRRGPCHGDSGSGLLTYEDHKWQLAGIISLAVKHPISGLCDLSQYVVFTDVSNLSFLLPCGVVCQEGGKSCLTPNMEYGECIEWAKCPNIYTSMANRPLNVPNRAFFASSLCAISNDKVFVCCKATKSNSDGSCATPDQRPGKCVHLEECASIYDALRFKRPLTEEDRSFMRRSQCGGYQGGRIKVCCPGEDTLLPTPGQGCGTMTMGNYVYGGERTLIDEFPWTVLLEYQKPQNKTDFHCGGILISNRYVLTAAHLQLISCQGNSPCPRIFRYIYNGQEWQGAIEVNSPPIGVTMNLIVVLLVPQKIHNENLGSLELWKTRDETLERISKGQKVHYRVKFPPNTSIPKVASITYNGNNICAQKPNYFEGLLGFMAMACGSSCLQTTNLSFICGGTLISERIIISAAHCFHNREERLYPAQDVIAFLGKHNLRKLTEKGAVIAEIAEIHIHPDFTRNNGGAFDADIAVLVLQKPAEFGDFIQPACLRHRESLPADRMGVIVGWGRDEHNNLLTYEPRRLEIPIVSEAECLAAGKIFSIITTPRTFCGGWRDGRRGPCHGDSGSGLLTYEDHKWQLAGIISLAVKHPISGLCDLSQYVVFTDVSKFVGWIEQF